MRGCSRRRWLPRRFYVLAAIPIASIAASAHPQAWDPPAVVDHPSHASSSVAALVDAGRSLFRTKFNLLDGAGRPDATGDSKPTLRAESHPGFSRVAGPDAASCAGCHNEPTIGGSGDIAANVFVGAHFTDPATTDTGATTTNERNTNTIAGAGAVEMLAREMTTELQSQLSSALSTSMTQRTNVRQMLATKGINFGYVVARADGTYDATGVEGIDADLVIKPFGRKGIIISLREFTVAALNQHHGIQAIERFGWEKTGSRDFDGDGVEDEFDIGQVTALTLFQASLRAPRNATPSLDNKDIQRGARLFRIAGCAGCHVPTLQLNARAFTEPNPYNRPGTASPHDVPILALPLPGIAQDDTAPVPVALYSDLKRHKICDDDHHQLCNESLRQDNVPVDEFITPRLWDLATSAPYGHRGDASTLSEVIVMHGGEARDAREAFLRLRTLDKRRLITFLTWLGSADHQP